MPLIPTLDSEELQTPHSHKAPRTQRASPRRNAKTVVGGRVSNELRVTLPVRSRNPVSPQHRSKHAAGNTSRQAPVKIHPEFPPRFSRTPQQPARGFCNFRYSAHAYYYRRTVGVKILCRHANAEREQKSVNPGLSYHCHWYLTGSNFTTCPHKNIALLKFAAFVTIDPGIIQLCKFRHAIASVRNSVHPCVPQTCHPPTFPVLGPFAVLVESPN